MIQAPKLPIFIQLLAIEPVKIKKNLVVHASVLMSVPNINPTKKNRHLSKTEKWRSYFTNCPSPRSGSYKTN